MADIIDNENLQEAFSELKRADHLIFVSLKYTRTVDVIKSIIERLINCLDFSIIALLESYKEKKKITDIPSSPVARAKKIKRDDR
ncbi:MAG: hypothetical protein ABII01_06810 [Candidatus Woesearchaeota archaeon]